MKSSLLVALFLTATAYAGNYSKADLYRLNHQIEQALDENDIDSARVQQAAAALEEAKRVIILRPTIPASISISDGPTFDFGAITPGSILTKIFTLSNAGGTVAGSLSANSLNAPFSFAGGTFPGTGGTCLSTLNVSSTCTIAVVFAPTTRAFFNDTITISYDDGYAQQSATRSIVGRGN